MELKQALDEKLLDYRIRDRLLAEGKLSKEDLVKYLNQLPDESKNVKTTSSSEIQGNSQSHLS